MEDRIRQIIAKVAKVEVDTICPDQELVKDLGIDSPKALELLCDLEDELGIELPDEAITDTNTVGDLLAIIPASLRETEGV